MTERIAAIDFGTNTARLLVADLTDSGFTHVHLEREIVRMGGGFSRDAGLSPEAWQRGTACLQRFAGIIAACGGVSRVRAVATSAVRDAANGGAFVDEVERTTGIRLEVINGVLEGELTLAGVLAGLDQRAGELVLFDIGGGSTEYTIARNGRAAFVHSLPLGVVRLTEGKGDPDAIREKIRRELADLQQEMARQSCSFTSGATLVGTAGTATTLAAICLEMKDYDYRRVNNSVVTRHQVQSIYDRLLPLSPEERLSTPGLERGREDLIIAGMLITLETMAMTGIDRMKVSDYGLLEGLVVAAGC